MSTPNSTQQCNSFKCLEIGCRCSPSAPFGSVYQIYKKALRPWMYVRLPEAVNNEEADLQDYEAPLLDAMDLSIPGMEGDNHWAFSTQETRPVTMTRVKPAVTPVNDRPSIGIVADNTSPPSEYDDFAVDIQALLQTAVNIPQCEREQDVVRNNTSVTVNVTTEQVMANDSESTQPDEESSDHATEEFTDDFLVYVNSIVDWLENTTNDSVVFNQQQHAHEEVNHSETLVDTLNEGPSNNYKNNAAVNDAVINTSSQSEAVQDKSSHGSAEEREDEPNDAPMHDFTVPEKRQRVTVQDSFVTVMRKRGYVNEHGVFRVPKSEAEDIAVASFKSQVKISRAGRKKRKAGPDRRTAYTKLHDALGHAGWKREVSGDSYYYNKV